MKKQLISIITICVMLLCITSCTEKKSFKLKLSNQSNYKIEKLIFSMGGLKTDTISIEPNNSSKILNLEYQKSWKENFSEPFLNFRILSYSDAGIIKKSISTGGVSRSQLEKKEITKIIITYNSEEKRFYFRRPE